MHRGKIIFTRIIEPMLYISCILSKICLIQTNTSRFESILVEEERMYRRKSPSPLSSTDALYFLHSSQGLSDSDKYKPFRINSCERRTNVSSEIPFTLVIYRCSYLPQSSHDSSDLDQHIPFQVILMEEESSSGISSAGASQVLEAQ